MRQQTSEEVRRNCVGRLVWQTAGRDDDSVAKAIHQGEEVDAVYNLDEVGLLDEFFHFLQ
ncbi:MAG: hypothetical protein HYY30_12890, partial [Chloroflexi bacterium]|nr:hypothetical protein [Chloroflexota bacterium]